MTLPWLQDHYTVRRNRWQLDYGRRITRCYQYHKSSQNGEDMGYSMICKDWKSWSLQEEKSSWPFVSLTSSQTLGPEDFTYMPVWAPALPLHRHCPLIVTCQQFCLSPRPLYTTTWHILPKRKSDSVISLLRLIQCLWWLEGWVVSMLPSKPIRTRKRCFLRVRYLLPPGVQCQADLQSHEQTVLTPTPPPATFALSCAPSLCRGNRPLFPANPHLLLTCPVLFLILIF